MKFVGLTVRNTIAYFKTILFFLQVIYWLEIHLVSMDMHCYMQGPGFEPQTLHLFILKKVNSSHYATRSKKKSSS